MAITLICYTLFLLATFCYWKLYKMNNNLDLIINNSVLKKLYLFGIFILAIPLINYKEHHFSFLQLPVFNTPQKFIVMIIAMAFTLIIAWKNAQAEGPYFKKSIGNYSLTPTYIGSYLFIRLVFLIVYELFFRGILLNITTIYWGIQ